MNGALADRSRVADPGLFNDLHDAGSLLPLARPDAL